MAGCCSSGSLVEGLVSCAGDELVVSVAIGFSLITFGDILGDISRICGGCDVVVFTSSASCVAGFFGSTLSIPEFMDCSGPKLMGARVVSDEEDDSANVVTVVTIGIEPARVGSTFDVTSLASVSVDAAPVTEDCVTSIAGAIGGIVDEDCSGGIELMTESAGGFLCSVDRPAVVMAGSLLLVVEKLSDDTTGVELVSTFATVGIAGTFCVSKLAGCEELLAGISSLFGLSEIFDSTGPVVLVDRVVSMGFSAACVLPTSTGLVVSEGVVIGADVDVDVDAGCDVDSMGVVIVVGLTSKCCTGVIVSSLGSVLATKVVNAGIDGVLAELVNIGSDVALVSSGTTFVFKSTIGVLG